MNSSVPFSISVVTKGKEKNPWLPLNYKHFLSQKPERRHGQPIKPNCLKVQPSQIQARWKVVLEQRLKTDGSVKKLHKQPVESH